MLQLLTDNWLALTLATLAAIGVSIIWYAPPAFGKAWQRLAGVKDKDLKKNMATKAAITLVLIFVTAFVLQRFFVITNPQTIFEALKVVAWIWLGFIVTYVVAGGGFEKVPYKLMAIDLSGQLITLLVMGTVLYYL